MPRPRGSIYRSRADIIIEIIENEYLYSNSFSHVKSLLISVRYVLIKHLLSGAVFNNMITTFKHLQKDINWQETAQKSRKIEKTTIFRMFYSIWPLLPIRKWQKGIPYSRYIISPPFRIWFFNFEVNHNVWWTNKEAYHFFMIFSCFFTIKKTASGGELPPLLNLKEQ